MEEKRVVYMILTVLQMTKQKPIDTEAEASMPLYMELLQLVGGAALIAVGANLFNLVLVSGVSISLAPFTIPQNSTICGINASLVMDVPVMFAVMLLLTVPALKKGRLYRSQGVLLPAIYVAFCVVQFSI